MTDRSKSEFLDRSILEKLSTGDADSLVRLHRELLAAVYVLAKNALVFPLNNPTVLQACDRAASVANTVRDYSDQRATLAFLATGVFVNNAALKLGTGAFEQGEYLFTVFRVLGVGEIATVDDTTADDWLELAGHFKKAVVAGDEQSLRELKLERIHLSPIEDAATGDTIDVSERFRALRAYSLVNLALEEIIERIASERSPKIRFLKRAIHQLIEAVDGSPELVMSLVHMRRHKVDPSHHGTNTTALVLAASRRLDLRRRQRTELALQAALHDIGQAFATDPDDEEACAVEWVRRWVPLTSVYYYNLGRLVVANEVRCELHPKKTRGSYPWSPWHASRLVAVAHAYDLMTSARSHRQALLPDDALRLLSAEADRRYDATAVKLLTNELGVYPVGSTVSLSDGRVAIVLEAPRDRSGPTSPRIKVVRDVGGALIDGAVIDLGGQSGLGISVLRCVDADDLDINTPAFLLG